jgi:hypothetical protein
MSSSLSSSPSSPPSSPSPPSPQIPTQAQDEELEEFVKKKYTTPGHPIAFGALSGIYKHFKGAISLPLIRRALSQIDGYTLHREYKRPHVFNPYFIYHRRALVQCDLIDIAKIKEKNKGVTFLLVLIDCFSRKLWVYPLKNKRGTTVRDAFVEWLNSLQKLPFKLQMDMGTEFWNTHVKELMKDKGVVLLAANGFSKASMAERVNKTLQILIYKYLSENETLKYIDVLSDLVKTYNTRGHRTLQYMTPNEADNPKNGPQVRGIHMMRYTKIFNKRKKPTLRKNDIVRIKTSSTRPSSSSRAYAEQFHTQQYKIIRVNTRMPIPTYTIQSVDSEELITGDFYANELTIVKGDIFKIEKIIKTQGKGRNKKHFVKWKDFGPQWNSWIKASDVVRGFK